METPTKLQRHWYYIQHSRHPVSTCLPCTSRPCFIDNGSDMM